MRKDTVALLVFCLAPMVWASCRLAHYRQWVTSAHRVQWVYEDGSAVTFDPDGYWRGCRPNDIFLDALLYADRLWTMCDDPQGGGNFGYAVIDPLRRRGLIARTRLQPIATSALARAGPETVAVIYRVDEINDGGLAYGILGPDGWVVPPKRVPESEAAAVLSFRAVDGGFELFVSPRGWAPAPDETMSAVWRYAG
ncbi:MAG: hypothetical protein AAFX94_13920, partial [Myxococcota bacterium]